MPQDEVDEIEVYGSEAQSGTQLATYSFEVRLRQQGPHPSQCPQRPLTFAVPQVCDSILNIGPCANAAMGEPAFLSEEVPRVVVRVVGRSWSVSGGGGHSPHS